MPQNLTDSEENRLLDLSLANGDKLALMTVCGTDAAAGTEVTGGSYARQSLTWAAASGGSKSNSAALLFNGMPAVDVQGWAVYDSAGTTRKWYGVHAGRTVSATAATDVITSTAHGFTDGTKVVFQDGHAPAGLSGNTTYFVRDSTANTFKVAATLGGTALDITADTTSAILGKVLEVASGAAVSIAVGAIVLSLS